MVTAMNDEGFHEYLIARAEGREPEQATEPTVQRGASVGESETSVGRPREDDRPALPYDMGGFTSVLTILGASVRLNMRTDAIEFAGPTTDDKRWRRADRHTLHTLYSHMREAARAPGDRSGRHWSPPRNLWDTLLSAIAMRDQHDAVAAWFDALPSHRPDAEAPRMVQSPETLLQSLFGSITSERDTAVMRYASRLLLGTVVHRTRHPGCYQKRVPVLVGDPGFGKSQLPGLLMPEAEWAGEMRLDIESDAGRRDQVELLRLSVMACADELAGLRADRVDAAKNALSARRDTSSPKYERHAVTIERRAAIHGNCNRNKKLPWDEGLQDRLLLTPLPNRPARPLEDIFDDDLRTLLWSSVVWHCDNDPAWQQHGRGLPEDAAAVARSNEIYSGMLTAKGAEMRLEWLAEREVARGIIL